MSRVGCRRAQQGLVALLLVAVVSVLALSLLVRTLNAAAWKADRYRVTSEALVQAKEALVARAVADDNRPGSLPCPDTDNDGVAELFAGTQCPSYLGRLPWKTLELPDIRDAYGERLWYVLSRTHRDHSAVEPLNSDTSGEISVNGMAPASQALAVVMSAGAALQRAGAAGIQQRDCPANCNAPANYLDAAGGFDNAVWAPSGGIVNLVAAAESESFNDRLLAILSDDVMPLVERRAGREISSHIRSLYESWASATGKGFYPWPAPFGNPANPGPGVSGELHGHLPDAASPVVWTSASTTLGFCTGTGTTRITCTAAVLLGLINISGRIDNIGGRFLQPPPAPQITGILPLFDTYTWSIDSSGALRFQYSALVSLTSVSVDAPATDSWAPSSAAWLVNNQWNRLATYAISPGHSVLGAGACSPPANPCISLGGAADKEAVVLMAGRALAGQTHPPLAFADYLEGGNLNASPSDLQLERGLRTGTFNDQPVVVRP